MKSKKESFIVEGNSSIGKTKTVTGITVYYILRKRPRWFHPITIWNGVCNLVINLFKRKGG